MALLNTHGFMPTSAATATGSAATLSVPTAGTAGELLMALGFALLILTAIFAAVAFYGMLPRGQSNGPS